MIQAGIWILYVLRIRIRVTLLAVGRDQASFSVTQFAIKSIALFRVRCQSKANHCPKYSVLFHFSSIIHYTSITILIEILIYVLVDMPVHLMSLQIYKTVVHRGFQWWNFLLCLLNFDSCNSSGSIDLACCYRFLGMGLDSWYTLSVLGRNHSSSCHKKWIFQDTAV